MTVNSPILLDINPMFFVSLMTFFLILLWTISGTWQGISLWINNLQGTNALKEGKYCEMKKPMTEFIPGSDYKIKYIKYIFYYWIFSVHWV